jgi:hypothetical protein
MPKLTEVHVVTYPTSRSRFADILFTTDLPDGLLRQFAGGLKSTDIAGIYTDPTEAEAHARELLKTIREG